MGREKVTVSLSAKCLELIDLYAQTTGFEARSRVIEEAIFAVTELLAYRRLYNQKAQIATKPNLTQQEAMNNLFMFADTLSKWGGILDRFERFPTVPQKQVTPSQNAPPQELNCNAKPQKKKMKKYVRKGLGK